VSPFDRPRYAYVHHLWFCVHCRAILRREHNEARSHKHLRLDQAKIKGAQRVLRLDTETETIEQALDWVISEHERNRLTAEANEHFVTSGIEIKDVYGTLEE
jgi:hypothetical protein